MQRDTNRALVLRNWKKRNAPSFDTVDADNAHNSEMSVTEDVRAKICPVNIITI